MTRKSWKEFQACGFDESSLDKGFKGLHAYLKNNIKDIYDETYRED